MNWEVVSQDPTLGKYFEMWGGQNHSDPNSLNVHGSTSPKDFLSRGLVQVWQSLLKNYTHDSGESMCSYGKTTNTDEGEPTSDILIESIYIRRFLHLPMQIFNPVNGSFQFVVCGFKGSEAMAFAELINVYD